MHEIARGIYAIDGLKMGRSYLVEGHDGLALIDTSSKSASSGILAAISAIGRRPEDLRTIVATHYHFDHTGNVSTLVERSGAQLCVHEDDVPYVEARSPWPPSKGLIGPLLNKFAPEQFSLKVDRALQDGDLLPFAGGLQVIHAPGHTPGHIALYAKERRTLFAGDALMNTGAAPADVDVEPRHGAGEAVGAPARRTGLRYRAAGAWRADPGACEREDRGVGAAVVVRRPSMNEQQRPA